LLAFVVSTVGLSTFVGAQVFLPGVAPGQARDHRCSAAADRT
jgi:hypothetical protein